MRRAISISILLMNAGCDASDDTTHGNTHRDGGTIDSSGDATVWDAAADHPSEQTDTQAPTDAVSGSDGAQQDAISPPPEGMVRVPAGTYPMGCDGSIAFACYDDETPVHDVTLDAYFIDRTEVSQADYGRCIDAGACTNPATNFDASSTLPVVFVSWNQSQAYCAWVNKRLPTEAEWEIAARGDDLRTFPWGNGDPTCELANYLECGGQFTQVGALPAGQSPFGALDMAGNAWEWVSDWYDETYYSGSPTSNPQGPESGTEKIYRGGSVASDKGEMRSVTRLMADPGFMFKIGIRCAKTAD